MKRILVMLILLLNSLGLLGQTNCVGSISVTLSPSMPTGGYAPGTAVSVCVSLVNYSQAGASWIHGVGIDFGPGWDTSTIVPVSPVPGCMGGGLWKWFNSCTAFGSGLTFGPGFYFDSSFGSPSGTIDNIPGNNYGDDCQNHTWTFCLTIQTSAASSVPIPLTGTVTVTSDGHSGSWGISGCAIEYFSFPALMGNSPCYAAFQLTTPPVVQMPLSFINTSTGVSPSYQWNFGDGNTSVLTDPIHTYPSTGSYPVCLTVSAASCSDTLCANIQIVPNYWQINYPYFATGELYYDLDSNGIRGPYEPGLQGVELNLSPIGISTFTQSSGNYNFPVNAGNYSISAPQISNWSLTSDSVSYSFSTSTSSIGNLHFGYKPIQEISALELSFNEGLPGCLWQVNQYINLRNTGTVAASGLITYLKHDSVNVISAIPPPDSVIQQVYYWNYNNLVPLSTHQIEVTVDKPNTVGYQFQHIVYGDIRSSSGQVLLSETDTIPETAICSYDPNDKTVAPITFIQGQNYTLLGTDLTYTIRFQNTGNAPALNVTIVDTLPAVLDFSSFQMISTSHQADVQISPGGILTFNFYGINLPDSVSNEPESHGYITFVISPLTTLANLTPVTNTAHIFFDFNSAIVTNTAQTIYVTNIPVGINEVSPTINFSVFPNPAITSFTVSRNKAGSACTISVLNVMGKIILLEKMNSENESYIIDSSNLSSGIYLIRVEDSSGLKTVKLFVDNPHR